MSSLTFDPRKFPAIGTRRLRVASITLVGLSFSAARVVTGSIGCSFESKNGAVLVSAGSKPIILIWDAVAILLFVVIMLRPSRSRAIGVPSRFRRLTAFAIDFWFGLLALSGIFALLPLFFEVIRTGHFAWQFQRDYAVSTDGLLALPSVLLFMASMFLYFAFPLTRGRQTVGCFILRLRTNPPFGDTGRFTFRAALKRAFYEFRGLCGFLTRGWKLDDQGRTWYDVETGCTVVLIGDD